MFTLTGKSAAVTGGGSGIGEAISLLFGGAGGARVFVLDVDEAAAKRTAESIVTAGGRDPGPRGDVSDGAEAASAVRATEQETGRLDVLVNNAGVAHIGTVETTGEADFDRVYRVNVKGLFLMSQAALPLLLHGGTGG